MAILDLKFALYFSSFLKKTNQTNHVPEDNKAEITG